MFSQGKWSPRGSVIVLFIIGVVTEPKCNTFVDIVCTAGGSGDHHVTMLLHGGEVSVHAAWPTSIMKELGMMDETGSVVCDRVEVIRKPAPAVEEEEL